MNSTKPNEKITWLHVFLAFLIGVAIPVGIVYFAAQAVDSGYFGGRPGYVSGDGILVWFVKNLHVVIISGFFGFFAFLGVLALKLHQIIKGR